MADWIIPGDYVKTENFGAEFDLSSSHHDFKGGRYIATLEMRDMATGEWLGPKVEVIADADGAKITALDGAVLEFPAIDFDHAGVQGLLDKAKIVAFVSAKLPDPRPTP